MDDGMIIQKTTAYKIQTFSIWFDFKEALNIELQDSIFREGWHLSSNKIHLKNPSSYLNQGRP